METSAEDRIEIISIQSIIEIISHFSAAVKFITIRKQMCEKLNAIITCPVFVETHSEISQFGLFRQFCVQKFSADITGDIEVHDHELALQSGKLAIL